MMRSQDNPAARLDSRPEASPEELALSESDEAARAQILSLLEWTGSLATLLEDPTPQFDKLEEVPGLRIVERRDLYQDNRELNFCGKHAFTSLGYATPENVVEGDTLAALSSAGYSLSNTPIEPGGIVYGNYRRGVFTGLHVGLVRGDKIESKFGYGHVIEHDTNRIFPNWGTHSIYFYKSK